MMDFIWGTGFSFTLKRDKALFSKAKQFRVDYYLNGSWIHVSFFRNTDRKPLMIKLKKDMERYNENPFSFWF